MNKEINAYELRNVKIAGEVFPINKFKKVGVYMDGFMNRYVVYTTEIGGKLVTFLKNQYDLLCTTNKDYFKIDNIEMGELDFYCWDIVSV